MLAPARTRRHVRRDVFDTALVGGADHLDDRPAAVVETTGDPLQCSRLIAHPVQRVEGHRDVEVVVERERQGVVDVELHPELFGRHPGQGFVDHASGRVDPHHGPLRQSLRQLHGDEPVTASDVEEALIAGQFEATNGDLGNHALQGADVGVSIAIPVDHAVLLHKPPLCGQLCRTGYGLLF